MKGNRSSVDHRQQFRTTSETIWFSSRRASTLRLTILLGRAVKRRTQIDSRPETIKLLVVILEIAANT